MKETEVDKTSEILTAPTQQKVNDSLQEYELSGYFSWVYLMQMCCCLTGSI